MYLFVHCDKVVGGADENLPSLPTGSGVKIVSYQKLLSQVAFYIVLFVLVISFMNSYSIFGSQRDFMLLLIIFFRVAVAYIHFPLQNLKTLQPYATLVEPQEHQR